MKELKKLRKLQGHPAYEGASAKFERLRVFLGARTEGSFSFAFEGDDWTATWASFRNPNGFVRREIASISRRAS